MTEFRVLAPTAILGYGFPEASFNEGMRRKPHVIAVDAGSTDPGPYYLGSGKSFTDRAAVKRDLEYMIKAGVEHSIPVIIGSAGGSGADSHLQWNVDIVKEIAAELELKFTLGVISSQINHNTVLDFFNNGGLKPMPSVPPITEEDIAASSNIVAQMGTEPLIKALDMGAQVIVAGRAYDPTVFACEAIRQGFDEGLALHMGKILECATIACEPGSGSDCMLGTLRADHFVLEPLSSVRKCTTLSVAAHTLYEKSDPTRLPGPGGVLDLTGCVFEQVTENAVKVSGTKFLRDSEYYVKLEGAALKGYRTVSIAASCDPIFIEKVDEIVAAVRERVRTNFSNLADGSYFLDFKLYGDASIAAQAATRSEKPRALSEETELGFAQHSGGAYPGVSRCAQAQATRPASETYETVVGAAPLFKSEICIIIEAVGRSQSVADTICSFARSSLLHYGYEGRKSTAGNLAFPFSPSDFEAGEVYNFSVYCLMPSPDPCRYFPIAIEEVDHA